MKRWLVFRYDAEGRLMETALGRGSVCEPVPELDPPSHEEGPVGYVTAHADDSGTPAHLEFVVACREPEVSTEAEASAVGSGTLRVERCETRIRQRRRARRTARRAS